MTREQAIAVGGREWKTADGKYDRVYFNDLADLFGLQSTCYGTGNISSATLDGERISNSRAREIVSALSGKFWLDVADGKFHWKLADCRTYSAQEMGSAIAETLRERAAALEVANAAE